MMINIALRSTFITILLISGLLCGDLPLTHAQVFSDAASVSLQIEGTTVKPNSEVSISLEAFTIDMVGATVRWFVDDREIVGARDNRSIMVTTGPVGSKKVVTVSIVRPGKTTITVTRTLTPSVIDVVVEARTHTPVFYEGRALPVAGGAIRLIAVPIVGTTADPATFSYDWKRNGSSLLGGPVLGRQAVDFETSRYGNETVTVTVYDARGNNLGTGAVSHNPVEPELYFYENNPLQGLTNRALADTFTLLGDEITIQAEPYFIDGNVTDINNQYEWSIDGKRADTSSAMSNSITLQRTENAGTAKIDLKLVTGESFPKLMRKSFSLFYQ